MKGKRVSVRDKADMRLRTKNGEKLVDIAEQYDVSLSTVQRAIRNTLGKPKKRGRPTKLTWNDRRNLVRAVRTNPTKSARSLAGSVGLAVSPRTIRRELKRNSFRHTRVKKVEALTSRHRTARLAFARKCVLWKKKK